MENIHIESLNDGYILNIKGKTRAVETRNKVREILTETLLDELKKIDHPSTHSMLIIIDVEVNPPKSKTLTP